MESHSAHATTSHRPQAGGREDCWSEGATETLIEAWGDRYLQLKRGNLRQKDWMEVADAVNSRQNGLKPQRTDVQCKNRVDTLKKKYKLEKAKPSQSKWPFYSRLHYLIGVDTPLTPLAKRSSKTLAVTVKSEPRPEHNSGGLLNSCGSGKGFGYDDMAAFGMNRHKNVKMLEEETTAFQELSRAILRFGEIYERIESAKQEKMMEMEKKRLEFTKEMEFRRLNMFVEAQLQIEKMNRLAKDISRSG